jgi:dual specificity tyrosine-phosphorylation-regulated kinase 2/3/4
VRRSSTIDEASRLDRPGKLITRVRSLVCRLPDTQGTARPVVNSKGKRRRPGTKTLSQVLKTDDELFVDFIAKCLTWDPDRRLKPMPALRHPWLVRQRLHQQSQHQQLPATASTPSSRLSLVSTGAAPTTVTGRIASSLTGTGRAKVITAETPKKVRRPLFGLASASTTSSD